MLWKNIKRHGGIQLNERIKLLAEQANELDYETFDEYNHKTVQHYKVNKEKFAELIIKECAWAADFADKNPGDYVLKHFGVEG